MKSLNMKRICTFLCAIVCSSMLFADIDADQLIAQSSKSKARAARQKKSQRTPNSWVPYFLKTKVVEPTKSSFYQQNVGIGFLYFSTIRGNLNPTNVTGAGITNKKLTGHLMYNRTPVAEFIVGTDILYWLKVALAYQHQGDIVVQTRPQFVVADAGGAVDLTSQVRLDAVQFKVYLLNPRTLVWKNMYYEQYLGLAVGPGWQTWIDNRTASVGSVTLRPKFSANCVYTVDLGVKLRKALPSYIMSFTAGCKYTGWGQARSIGKITQQYNSSAGVSGTGRNGFPAALNNPVSIKTVYQFAPYVGVQFNF